MVYKYCESRNFEDLASGKVIVHRTGYPNFPVRLAQEIFCRCLHYLDDPGSVCIYDPCCGGGYLLTVLGFLNFERIGTILASDISEEAVQLAGENLSLLSKDGLEQRIRQLDMLLPAARSGSVIAICSDKSQKFQSRYFQRVEKQVVGKRLFQIFRLAQT